MRIAAIDCGSNSFHLLIADAYGHDQMVVIEDDKSLLHLGAEVASTGVISHASLLRARRVIRHYKTLIARHEVDAVRCVATSAIRSAENGGEIIEALCNTLGFPIRVISGEEEAETIFRGISAVSTLPESRILACDMGGGSLEVMAGQRHGLEFATSVPLGASRVARELSVSDPLSSDDIARLQNMCRTHFEEFTKEYPSELFSHIVASSGTLTTLIAMARARVDGYVSPPLSVISASADEMSALTEIIIQSNTKAQKKLQGYDKDRKEFLAAAAVIAQEISRLARDDTPWMISPYALREGMLFRIADKYENEAIDQYAIAARTVEDLEHRMSVFSPVKSPWRDTESTSLLVRHGRHVETLATSLFDALVPLHKLRAHDRTLLSYAARLHDIGETISHSKHDGHGAYILSNIALVGFTPEDALALRGIVRWHRTRDPKSHDRFVGRLDDETLERVMWLTAILRIADGADSGKSAAISHMDISIKPDLVFIRCFSEKECELEMYSARRKRKLLEKVTSRDIVIEPALSRQLVQD